MKKILLSLILISFSYSQTTLWKIVGSKVYLANKFWTLSMREGMGTGMQLGYVTSGDSGSVRYYNGILQYYDGGAWRTVGYSGDPNSFSKPQIDTVGTVVSGTWNASTITTTYGGTGLTSYTQGDIPYYNSGTAFSKLALGSSNQILGVSNAAPTIEYKTLATTAIGTDFTISYSGSTVNFNLPTASAINRGALSTTDWTTFNNKKDQTDSVNAISGYVTNWQKYLDSLANLAHLEDTTLLSPYIAYKTQSNTFSLGTTQSMGALKFDTSTAKSSGNKMYLNDTTEFLKDVRLNMPDSISKSIIFDTHDEEGWKIYVQNVTFNGIQNRVFKINFNSDASQVFATHRNPSKPFFQFGMESEYYNGIDTLTEMSFDFLPPLYSPYQPSVNQTMRLLYFTVNKYTGISSLELWANTFLVKDTLNSRSHNIFSIYPSDSVVFENKTQLKFRSPSSSATFNLSGNSSQVKDLIWSSYVNGDSARFIMRVSGAEDPNGNGGNLTLMSRNNNGSAKTTLLTINRLADSWTWANGKTYAFGATSTITGGAWSGTTGVFSSTISATTATLTGDIVLTGSMYSADNTSNLVVSGGNGTGAGANMILYGGAEVSTPADIRFRDGTTDKLKYNHTAGNWTFSTPVTLGSNAFTSGAIRATSLTHVDSIKTPRLRFIPETNNMVEPGRVWWDSTQRTFYGTQFLVNRSFDMSHNMHCDSLFVGLTTSETDIDTVIQGANYPAANKIVETVIQGVYNATAGGSKTFIFRVRHSGVLIDSVTLTTPAGGSTTEIIKLIHTLGYRTTGASGVVISDIAVTSENGVKMNGKTLYSYDTTSDNSFIISVQISDATAGNNFQRELTRTTTYN